jgi:Tol biopolymer transport system component/predicted Ser/Thr protein kinase
MSPPSAPPPDAVGRTFSHYRILENLGAGGMGEVYRARDEKLGRDVAVKILPAGLLNDEAARRRFQREARILSRLAHPHIATLLDFDHASGADFLVMELVTGPSLSALVHGARLPEKEVVRLGAQLARALIAAHAAGIVHRDIKPSNLKLTADGLLKVLDFGIAALPATVAGAPDDQTQTGRFAGSLPYVAPEQLLGEADARADLYGAGTVLYELATGRPPFDGLGGVELTDAILHRPPDPPRESRTDLSPGLEAVVLKLLDKDRELRYQTARELLVDLERLQQQTTSPLRLARPVRRRRRWVWGAVALALLAAAGGAMALRHRLLVGTVAAGEPKVTPLTTSPDLERYPALSADGRRVAFVWDRAGNSDLYVQDIGSYSPQRATSDGQPVCCPAWAPDGLSLAFVRMPSGDGAIFTVPVGGGAPRRLRALTPWFGTKLSFSPDGSAIAFSDRAEPSGPFVVQVLSLDTLEARPLTAPVGAGLSDGFPTFSPDGRWIAFARVAWTVGSSIYVVRATGGEPRLLVRDAGLVGDLDWSPDGASVVFWSPTSPKRLLRVDLAGGAPAPFWAVTTSPNQGCAEAPTKIGFVSRFSIARGSPRAVVTWGDCDSDIFEYALGGPASERIRPRALIASTRADDSPQFSPDGRRVAFASTRAGPPQIWTCDADGRACAPLTAASDHDGTPRWSPDGKAIAFDARPFGHGDVFAIDLATRATRRLTSGTAESVVPSWSADGRWVYFATDRTGRWEVFKVPAEGGREVQVTREGGFAAFELANGAGVFYSKFDEPGLWRVPAPGEPAQRVSAGPDCWGHWAVGPDALYLVGPGARGEPILSRLDPRTGRTQRVLTLPSSPPCGESSLAVSPDGGRLLYSAVSEKSDLLLVDAGP